MNSVERVKAICKERKIAISKLEKDLGYANGYIGQLRKGTFPADRLSEIAAYLSVSPDYLLFGDDSKNARTMNGERKASDVDILDEVDVAFYGEFKELDDDDKETVREMVRVMRQRRARRQEN